MIWKGHELKTVGDLMTHGIDACLNRQEAQQFIAEYAAENVYARENIGYLAGYYSQEKAQQIYDWFDVSHPIFGRKNPNFEEAFQAGVQIAQKAKENETFGPSTSSWNLVLKEISEIIAHNLGD